MAGIPPGPIYAPLQELDANRVEPLHQYRQGGLHPILVGEILGGRYGVFDKLGHGQSSTVWLCLDRKSRGFKWCAVKVLAAEVSTEDSNELRFARILRQMHLKGSHLLPPFDHFWIEGPNGRHLCLVSDVVGPSITSVLVTDPRDILFQAAESLQFLHQHGMCHGNLQPANIRFRIPSHRRVNEAGIGNILGPPRRETVVTLNAEGTQRGPTHVYQSKAFPIAQTDDIEIAVIDFSATFEVDDPPQFSRLPLEHMSPGVALDRELDPSMDVWALVTTIVLLRTDSPMFAGLDRETLVQDFELRMGLMPNPYNVDHRVRIWEDQGQHGILALDPTQPVTMHIAHYNFMIAQHGAAFPGRDPLSAHTAKPQSILTRRPGIDDVNLPPHRHDFVLSEEEVESLSDLFRRSFRYHPAERLDLAGVMSHGYFEGRQSRIRGDPGALRGIFEAGKFLVEHWRFCLFLLGILIVSLIRSWWVHRVVYGTCWAIPGWEYSCYFTRNWAISDIFLRIS